MVKAAIAAIEYELPKQCIANQQLAREFPDWSIEKIEQKTGIAERWAAAEDECSSDLGAAAARKLFANGACKPLDIDYILFCTQSPDYFLPTSACLLQHRLGIPASAGALDFNLGCSGYIYGLGLAKALIENGQAANVLLLTAETYSKFMHPGDRSVRALFGDAGAATLVRGVAGDEEEIIGPFIYGTDGRGAENLIVPAGGMRQRKSPLQEAVMDAEGNLRSAANLYMNGPEIFAFTLQTVPDAVQRLLERTGKNVNDIDQFVFHQANQYMLEHLRKKLKIPLDRFFISMRHTGNTVSCTIPIALKQASEQERIHQGDLLMLVGFGVGYSWGATLLQWM